MKNDRSDLSAIYIPPPLLEKLCLKEVLVLLKLRLDACRHTAPPFEPAELKMKWLAVRLTIVFCRYIPPPYIIAMLE